MGRASRKAAHVESVKTATSAQGRGGASAATWALPKLWAVPGLVLACTFTLLIYPPYFRALYFTREQLITMIITLVAFGLWWGFKLQVRDHRFFGGPLDYFALAAALAWTLSVVVAVNPRGAIQEALKNLNYFLIYWLVAEQVRSKHSMLHRNPRPVLGVMYLSALGVALVGLGAAAGVVKYNGAFVSGRIASTIQYANSLAAYLTAAFFVGLGLWLAPVDADSAPETGFRRLWGRARTGAFAGTAAAILLTFIFTLSRGAWLVFPVALVLFILLAGSGARLRATAYFSAVFAAALAASPFMAKGISDSRASYIELAILLALVLGVGLGYLAELYLSRSVRWKVALATALIAAVVVGGGAVFGLAATKALTLAHLRSEKDGSKTLNQGLADLDPDASYILKFEVEAAGDASKPYAWRVIVYGYNPETGANKVLANQSGKPTSGWQPVEVEVAPSQGTTGVTLQLSNYYAGTQATFRNLAIVSTEGEVVSRPGFTLAKVLPASIYNRIGNISLGTVGAESRFGFNTDALKMVRDYPVLGMGGSGWASAFMKYQSYGYYSREIHDHFLQIWVDTGTVGFLAWLALWGAFLYVGFRLVGPNRAGSVPSELMAPADSRLLLAGILTAAAAIGAHSVIDFNLSLPAVSFYLWAILGLISAAGSASAGERGAPKGNERQPFVPEAALPLVLAVAGVFFAGRLLIGYDAGQQAVAPTTASNVAQAQVAFQKAIEYDPWTASFHVDLGRLTHSTQEIEHGIELDPLNPKYHQLLGIQYFQQNEAQKGLAELDKSVALEPFQQAAYEQVAGFEYQVGEGLFQMGRVDLAKPLLQRVLDLQRQMNSRAAQVPKTVPAASRLNPNAPGLSLTIGRAQALLGDRTAALVSLGRAANNRDTANEANVWLAALYGAEKNTKAAVPYLAKIKAAGRQTESRYANVLSMLISPS